MGCQGNQARVPALAPTGEAVTAWLWALGQGCRFPGASPLPAAREQHRSRTDQEDTLRLPSQPGGLLGSHCCDLGRSLCLAVPQFPNRARDEGWDLPPGLMTLNEGIRGGDLGPCWGRSDTEIRLVPHSSCVEGWGGALCLWDVGGALCLPHMSALWRSWSPVTLELGTER